MTSIFGWLTTFSASISFWSLSKRCHLILFLGAKCLEIQRNLLCLNRDSDDSPAPSSWFILCSCASLYFPKSSSHLDMDMLFGHSTGLLCMLGKSFNFGLVFGGFLRLSTLQKYVMINFFVCCKRGLSLQSKLEVHQLYVTDFCVCVCVFFGVLGCVCVCVRGERSCVRKKCIPKVVLTKFIANYPNMEKSQNLSLLRFSNR